MNFTSDSSSKDIGSLIVVVGPSGSGKDSLLAAVGKHYVDNVGVKIVQRVITRPADAGHEPHRPMTKDEFLAARERGEFAVTWGAHSLHYGVPVHVHQWLAEGRVAILNGSRAAMDNIRQVFPSSRTVLVSVHESTLASRLVNRARENSSDISSRLGRKPDMLLREGLDIEIDNSGELQTAAKQLLDYIDSVRLN